MKITVLNTGGTFNKKYNPITGQLVVLDNSESIKKIIKECHNVEFEVINLISKDSLDMTDKDRELLVETVNSLKNNNIIIIHGTDTMNISARYLDDRIKDKSIIFTGSMIPVSIDETEGTINFSLALGFLNTRCKNGVYIAMHGVVCHHDKIYKDKTKGKFLSTLCQQ